MERITALFPFAALTEVRSVITEPYSFSAICVAGFKTARHPKQIKRDVVTTLDVASITREVKDTAIAFTIPVFIIEVRPSGELGDFTPSETMSKDEMLEDIGERGEVVCGSGGVGVVLPLGRTEQLI